MAIDEFIKNEQSNTESGRGFGYFIGTGYDTGYGRGSGFIEINGCGAGTGEGSGCEDGIGFGYGRGCSCVFMGFGSVFSSGAGSDHCSGGNQVCP